MVPGAAVKKFLFFLVVGLFAVLLAVPWFLGSFTERKLEERLDAGADTRPGMAIVTEEYRRRWFSSDSRHRIVITEPRATEAVRSLAGGEVFADEPAIVIDTRIEHGPLPRGADAPLRPGLSRAESTFSLHPGTDRDGVPLPGRLVTTMALDGSTHAEFRLQAGSRELPDAEGRVSWEAAGLDADISADGRRIHTRGRMGGFELVAREGPDGGKARIRIADVEGDSVQRYTANGIPVGPIAVTIGTVSVTGDDADVSIRDIRLTSDGELVGELLSGTTEVRVGRIEGGGPGPLSLTLELAMQNVHEPSLASLSEIIQTLEGAGSQISPGETYRLMAPDLARLAAEGPVLDLRKLGIALPDGEVRLTSYLALAAGGDPAAPLEARELLERLAGTVELRIPTRVVEQVRSIAPDAAAQLEMLIAAGMLRPDGADYRMQAEYGNGLLTVNGLPLPIPLTW